MTSRNFARIRFVMVMRRSQNRPFFDSAHRCVKPRKSNACGFPRPRAARHQAACRPNSISWILQYRGALFKNQIRILVVQQILDRGAEHSCPLCRGRVPLTARMSKANVSSAFPARIVGLRPNTFHAVGRWRQVTSPVQHIIV